MIAPGLSIDTVRIPPLVVEVRHLVWKQKNHLQKLCRDFSQGIFTGMFKILASKECARFQNVAQYKDHMLLTPGYWFLYLLHYLHLFRTLNHRLLKCTRTTALTQEFTSVKHSVSLPQMRPKWPTQQIQEVTDCTLWHLLLSSVFCAPKKYPVQRAQQAQNCMGRVYGGRAEWPHWALPFSFLNCFTGWYAY